MQLDSDQRGFSFRTDSNLDMRFNPKGDVTAARIVYTVPRTHHVSIPASAFVVEKAMYLKSSSFTK